MNEAEAPIHDLTHKATLGELEPAYGREPQILSILEILARRDAKSVLLVGPPGVGKSRIVSGLAVAGARGETAHLFENFHIVELDTGLLLYGGDTYRKKMRVLVKYLREYRDNILFVDNIHQIYEEDGTADSTREALAGMLKPALLRGEVSCIATTTPDKFDDYLIHDKAIHEYFEVVEVEPMTSIETRRVLGKVRNQLELHHKVEISDEALDTVVELCERFMPEKYFPGKASDVLDRACARLRFKSDAHETKLERKPENKKESSKKVLRKHEVEVVVEELSRVTSERFALPDKWKRLETKLLRLLIGQPYAFSKILGTLKKRDERRGESMRPEAIFLFYGPRNSGKSLLPPNLAEMYLGSRDRLITFDMADFTEEKFSEALFSFQESSGRSTPSQFKSRSSSHAPSVLVLFESIEKAKSESFDFLLPILQQGVHRDSLGRNLSLQNTLFIFSTEQGADEVTREEFRGISSSFIKSLRRGLRKEFLAEIDAIVPFLPLTEGHLQKLVHGQVKRLRKELKERRIGVALHKDAYNFIVAAVSDQSPSHQSFFTEVDVLLLSPIRVIVQEKRPEAGTVICVVLKDDKLVYKRVSRKYQRNITNTERMS